MTLASILQLQPPFELIPTFTVLDDGTLEWTARRALLDWTARPALLDWAARIAHLDWTMPDTEP